MFGEEFSGDEDLGIVRVDVIAEGMSDMSEWIDEDIADRLDKNMKNSTGKSRYDAKRNTRNKLMDRVNKDTL